jgi:ATP-binding cassette subfamily B protein
LLGQRGVNLSGDQKQRLGIARAILTRPGILILDDSLSAVDVVTGCRIKEQMRASLQGMTCLMITQRISTALDADRILVMNDGRIADIGTHLDLMAGCAIYRVIYDSQLGGREETSNGKPC